MLFERSKRMPSLDEVMNIDPEWESDVIMVLNYLDWIRQEGREVPRADLWQT